MLSGLFGGLKRKLIEGRLTDESAAVVRVVRRRLEGGDPPPIPMRRGVPAGID